MNATKRTHPLRTRPTNSDVLTSSSIVRPTNRAHRRHRAKEVVPLEDWSTATSKARMLQIWPRSYDSSNELTFDENGVAFPLHERPSLSRILRRSRISSLNGNNAYKDSYNYNSFNNFS